MVNVHGAARVGNAVFLRKFCYCGAPALYVIGHQHFCKNHKDSACKGAQAVASHYDKTRSNEVEENRKLRDAELQSAYRHHKATGTGKRMKP